MFKNMRLVILFDMFLNPSFKMTASFANIARTTASASKLIFFNIKLVFNSLKIKNYFSYKDLIPDDLKSFLVYNLLVLAVVLATLAKLVVILKLRLRSISKTITSLIFLNIYTPPQHALTHIILFVLK